MATKTWNSTLKKTPNRTKQFLGRLQGFILTKLVYGRLLEGFFKKNLRGAFRWILEKKRVLNGGMVEHAL